MDLELIMAFQIAQEIDQDGVKYIYDGKLTETVVILKGTQILGYLLKL